MANNQIVGQQNLLLLANHPEVHDLDDEVSNFEWRGVAIRGSKRTKKLTVNDAE